MNNKLKNGLVYLFNAIAKPRWIVGKDGDLGLRVFGFNCWYYKWADPIVIIGNGEDCFSTWRIMEKREFGESIKSDIFKLNQEIKEDKLRQRMIAFEQKTGFSTTDADV